MIVDKDRLAHVEGLRQIIAGTHECARLLPPLFGKGVQSLGLRFGAHLKSISLRRL